MERTTATQCHMDAKVEKSLCMEAARVTLGQPSSQSNLPHAAVKGEKVREGNQACSPVLIGERMGYK